MKPNAHERSSEEVKNLLSEHNSRLLISRAWDFARKAHAGQQRRSGEPHTEHLFQTALNLSNLGMSPTVIAAGILHDTLEDTEVTYAELENEFGSEIAFLVDGVTKLKKQHMPGEDRQIESVRKMLLAAARDPRIVVIKLCDRLHNMQTLEYMPPRKRQRIARETLEIYVPAAERLGMNDIRRKLEDLAFVYAFPAEYKESEELFQKALPSRLEEARLIKDAIILIQKKELIEIHMRIKGLYGFFTKLKRKNNDLSLIQDIVAVQIIVPTVDACYVMLGF